MKTNLILILMNLLFSCSTISNEKTISIIDNRNSKAPIESIDSNKEKDLKINRIAGFYSGTTYLMDSSKLKEYKFYTSSIDDYDKATYKWINDTTMRLKLINSSNNLSVNFKMTISGNLTILVRY